MVCYAHRMCSSQRIFILIICATDAAGETDSKEEQESPKDLNNEEEEEESENTADCQPDMTNLPVSVLKYRNRADIIVYCLGQDQEDMELGDLSLEDVASGDESEGWAL